MTQYAVPSAVVNSTSWTRFDGVSAVVVDDIDDGTTSDDSNGAQIAVSPNFLPLRVALSPITLDEATAGNYKLKFRFRTDTDQDCQVDVTLFGTGGGIVAYDTPAIFNEADDADPDCPPDFHCNPLFHDYEYTLTQPDVDLLLARSDGTDLELEFTVFNTSAPFDAFKVSNVFFEAAGVPVDGGGDDEGGEPDDHGLIVVEPPPPNTWQPDQPDTQNWGQPTVPASTGPDTFPWQQLGPVVETGGADEPDTVDFVLRVDDIFPLLVTDTWPSHYIVDDIETP